MSREFNFAVGRTNPETFPIEKMQQAANRAIEREFAEITNYHGKLGHLGLRKAMAQRESEREGVPVDAELVSLMNGSMQAVTLVAEALTQPQDTVICEEFTYGGTIAAYRSLKINMVGLPIDDDGMQIDFLEPAIRKLGTERKPKFIYALTTYQNPSGTIMSRDRRLRLIDIAARHDIPVVEDNCYGDVHYDGEKPQALYALSDYDKIIYICSLSKILAPGLRLGYLMAQQPLFNTILERRHDAGGNYLTASIVAELYQDGGWDITNELNESLKIKKNLVVDGLQNELSDICAWSDPAGGLFVWVRLPEDTDMDKLQSIAASRNVFFAPGENFHIHGKQSSYLRLAFGHVTDQDIRDGIPRLATCIKEARTSNAKKNFNGLFDKRPNSIAGG